MSVYVSVQENHPVFYSIDSSGHTYILANMGHSGIVCCLDEFLIVADTHAKCLETMSALQKTLRALGFHN